MTTLQTILAALNWHTRTNENFETVSAAGIFGKRHSDTTGLTWGYYGGVYNGNTISNGIVTLTNAATNYVVVNRATGVVSVSTSTTNWTDPTYARLYQLTTAGNVVTATIDARWDTNGLFAQTGGTGKHAIWVPASAMQPSVSGGCAALATSASAANQPDICTLDFDASSQEFAQFSIAMPKSWDEGTVTFRPVWSHGAAVTNFGVVWQLQGVAVSDDDTIAANYGTAQTSTDTGGTTNDLYRGPESSAITIAGTPAAEDIVFFRIARNPSDGSDTLAVDARLHGVVLFVTLDAGNDA